MHNVPFLGIVPLYMIDVSAAAAAAVFRLFFSGSVLSCMFTKRLEFFVFVGEMISDVIILLPLFVEWDPFDTAEEAVEFDDVVEDVVDAAI